MTTGKQDPTPDEFRRWVRAAGNAALSHRHTSECGKGMVAEKKPCICGVQEGVDAVQHLADGAQHATALRTRLEAAETTLRAAHAVLSTAKVATQDRLDDGATGELSLSGRILRLHGRCLATEARELELACARDALRAQVERFMEGDRHLAHLMDQLGVTSMETLAAERDALATKVEAVRPLLPLLQSLVSGALRAGDAGNERAWLSPSRDLDLNHAQVRAVIAAFATPPAEVKAEEVGHG